MDKPKRKVFDAHSHIGTMTPFKYYGLPEPIQPTWFEFEDAKAEIKDMDAFGVERRMIISNYGIPDSAQPFTLNPLVVNSCEHDDRFVGAIWTSPMLKDKERNEEALKHAGDKGIKALKVTCLLGGSYKPADWDTDTRAMWDNMVDVAEKNNLMYHMHTSPGGSSDISNEIEFIKLYGKRIKIFVVHFGGGVSGHIKFGPQFIGLVKEGYKIYGDFTWSVGFGPRWMLHTLQETGECWDRFVFSSDTPWSDFWGEYYKIEGCDVSEELKNRIFYQNAVDLYDSCGRKR